MDNKDEKTFTDLFSSFKEEQEITTETFGDILNNSVNEEQNIDNITFDSLFEQVCSDEELNNNTNNTSKDKFVYSDDYNINPFVGMDESIQENSGVIEELNSNEPIIEINPLFEETTIEETTLETNPKEEIIMEDNPFIKEINFSSNDAINDNDDSSINPFMDTTEPIQENSEVIGENVSEEPAVEVNPFFNEETSKEERIIEDNPFIKEINFSSNDAINDNDDSIINPFMDTTEPTQENSEVMGENVSEEPAVEANPFFNEETPKEERIIEDNPFIKETNSLPNDAINDNDDSSINPFMDTTEPIQENNIVTNDETISKEQLEEKNPFFDNQVKESEQELKNIPSKSISPFFEEEKKNEENPFFQNQLNLVENKVPDNPKGTIDSTKSKHYNVKIVKKKEPLIKLVLGVLSYALFIWLLLIGITLLVYVLDIKIRAAKGDYSSPTFNAYVVLTGSMLPEIEVYDVVVTKKIDATKLKEGDVITFSSADSRFLNTIITHRIIKKNPPSETEGYTFQTKGDNNNVADSALVPENRIFGKVILKIPKLGYLQEFLATRGGWIIVILIPCLTVISYDTVKLIKGLKKKKYKNIKVQK